MEGDDSREVGHPSASGDTRFRGLMGRRKLDSFRNFFGILL